jgi:membrane protein implicated in regulation of membrane protease activity
MKDTLTKSFVRGARAGAALAALAFLILGAWHWQFAIASILLLLAVIITKPEGDYSTLGESVRQDHANRVVARDRITKRVL